MKENSSFGRGAAVVFLLVFVAFLGFRVYDGLSEKMTTMDATLVKVEELLSVDGTFIRDQIIVVDDNKDAEYMVENGEKVSVGQGVIISFDNDIAAENYKILKSIESSIDALTYINSITNSDTDGNKLDGLVYSQLDRLVNYTNNGQIGKISKEYITLKQLVVARDVGLFNDSDLNSEIISLKKEAEDYSKSIESSSNVVHSLYSGYFLYSADGYESIFNKGCIDKLSSSSLINGKSSGLILPENTIGSIVNDFYWYVAFTTTGEKASEMERMDTVEAYIPNISSKKESFTVEKVIRDGVENAIVVLKCPVMSAEYLSTRFQTVDVVLNTYEGIKVPIDALHQEGGIWGVYCLEGSSTVFKPVKIIYQGDNFYLLEMAESSKKGIYIYDKIVIGGKD